MFPYLQIFNFGFNIDNPRYNLVKLAILCNALMISVVLFFSFTNIFLIQNKNIGYIALLLALSLVISLVFLKKYTSVKIFLLSTTLFLFFLSLAYYFYGFTAHKIYFSSIWLLFFPLVAFLLNGLKIGQTFTSVYIFIIIFHAYNKIGTYITRVEFLNILIGLIVFSMLVYLFEYSRKEAFEKMLLSIQKLETISNIDELTQLYNRHFLKNNILKNEQFKRKPLLFCISDIDNFKEYNDTYGHQKGDDTLKKIAEVKKATIGMHENNFIVRLGGEEFGCFIFDTKKAKTYINDFFHKLSSLKIEHVKNNPFDFCTVSIGAVYCQNKDGLNFTELYKLADEALYEAKKSGKNQIIYKNISKMDQK